MPIARFQLPDGRIARFEVPEGTSPEEAQQMMEQSVSKGLPKAPPEPGFMKTVSENVAGGFGNALRGAGAAAAHYLGADSIAAKLDASRAAEQAKMDAAGGKSFTGETAATVGSLSPALAIGAAGTAAAPFTGGLSLLLAEVANAGLFGLPAFRDTYDAQIKEGASQSVAIQHALAEAGLATVGGKIIGSGGKILSGGMQAGEKLLPKLAAGAAEGAAFPEVGRVMEKGIDVANDRENDKSWLVDPQTAASSAAGFGILRGAHHAMEAPARGRAEQARAQAAEEATAAENAKVAADAQAQEDADHQRKLADPVYHETVANDYAAAEAKRAELRKLAKAGENASMADKMQAADAAAQLKEFEDGELKDKAAAYLEVKPLIEQRQAAEKEQVAAQEKAAEDERQAKLADPEVQADLTDKLQQAQTALAQANTASDAALKSGDLGTVRALEKEIDGHIATIRELQPQIAPPKAAEPTPQELKIKEAQKELTRLQKQYANARRTGETDVRAQLLAEIEPLQKQVTDYNDAVSTQNLRDADLRAQVAPVKAENSMAAYVDPEQNEARAKVEQETGTGKEIAAMGENRMNTGVTDQQDLFGGTQTSHPQKVTEDSLANRISRVPDNIAPAQKALLARLQDNLPAVAADPEKSAIAADWVHRLALGPQTAAQGEASRDMGGYREKDVAAMLAASEQGRRSETQQTLVSQYRALTPEQKTSLVGTQGYRNREVTPQMLPTRAEPIQRAVQGEMPLYPTQGQTGGVEGPQKSQGMPRVGEFSQVTPGTPQTSQGKLFPTVQAFQKFLGSEALHKARVLGGQAVQTLSRAFQKIKPLDARIAQLEKAAAEAQASYERTVALGNKGNADAIAAQDAAQSRLKNITDALDKELQPLQIQWMEARNAFKAAAEDSFDIADKIYQNATRFEMVKGDAAEAMKAIVDAKERLATAVAADVSKAGWDEMRAAQQAIPVAEAFFETHRLALPEELNRYLKADRALNAQLEQAVKVEGQLQTAHDAAREALDRVAANQKRRPSVKSARSEAETAARAAKLQTEAAAKVAHDEKLAAGEAASAVETAKRTSAVEKAALLKPVIDAQAARTAVPEKERVTLAGRKQSLTDAETAAIARAHAELPGRSVDATKRREWLNQIDDAARVLRTAREKLGKVSTPEAYEAVKNQIDKASVDVNNLLRRLGEKETSAEATNKKITAQLKRIEKLEGDGVGGANEPGIEQKLHDSRIKDLNRARKALTNLETLQDKQTGVKTKEKIDTETNTGRAADENDRIVDAMSDATIGLDKAEQEGNKMKIAFFKNQLTLLADGKLPPRKIGPLTKKERTAGNTRTGTEESKAGDMATSPQNKITQSGKRRGATAHQAVAEGNRVSAERAKREAEQQEKDEATLQDELDAELAKETLRGGGDDGIYRTTDQKGKGSSPEEVTRLKDRIIKDWTNVPEIEVVATEADLPGHLREQMSKDGVEGKVPGLMDTKTGKVYLVAENLHNGNDVALTIAHEIAGHHGLRTMLGDKYAETMKRLYEGNAAIREVADKRMADNKNMEQGIAVEEALAEMAENPGAHVSALARVFHAIKQWFAQKLGIKNVSDAEVRQIVANARQHVMSGTPGGPKGGGEKAVYRTATSALADSVIAKPVPFKERLADNFGSRFEMKYVDMRAPVIKALKAAGDKAAQNASYLIRKADARMSHTFAVMSHGALGMRKDAKGLVVIEAGHSKSAKDVYQAVGKVKGTDVTDKMVKAQLYLTAKRAERVGWGKLGFDPARVAMLEQQGRAFMKEVNADPAQKAALDNVAAVYGDLNKGLINFMADTGALPKAKAAELLKHNDYVPFYRVLKDGTAILDLGESNIYPMGNIRTQPYLQSLKGGDQMLLPLNEAIGRNVMMLTDMSMRNMATKDVAYALQTIGAPAKKMRILHGDGPASGHILRFTQEPDPKRPDDDGHRHVLIDTEGTGAEGVPADLLAHSLEGSFAVIPDFMKAASWFGDVLRSGVTRNPAYIARQLIRDPMAAAFTGGMDTGAVNSVFKSIAEFGGQVTGTSKTGNELIKKGLIHSNIFTGDNDDMAKMGNMLAQGEQSAYDRLIAAVDGAAMKADGATRATMYDSARRQGLSEQEAEMAAMEMMNFNKRGMSPTVQYASRMIPFFNAQIQGLNVLYKAATGTMPQQERLKIKEKFFNRAMMMAAGTLIYAAAMDDDETYKNAKARDRYNFWMVPNPIGEEHLKIPIPFEVGVLFKMLPEALLDTVKGKFGGQEWDAVKQALIQNIPGSGNALVVPQAVKPVIEVVTNHSFFTGREIEPVSKAGLDPSQRFTAGTTEWAKAFSQMLEKQPIDALKLSPPQIESLTRGYLGSLPIMVARMTNTIFAQAENSPKVEPDARASDNPLLGVFFQKKEGGGAVEAAYAQSKALSQAAATFNAMVKRGDRAAAKEYQENVLSVLSSPQLAKNFTARMTLMKTQEENLRKSSLDPGSLRERLNVIDANRRKAAQMLLDAVDAVPH